MTRIYVVGRNMREMDDYVRVMRSPGIEFVKVFDGHVLYGLRPEITVHLIGRYTEHPEWTLINVILKTRRMDVVEVAEWR